MHIRRLSKKPNPDIDKKLSNLDKQCSKEPTNKITIIKSKNRRSLISSKNTAAYSLPNLTTAKTEKDLTLFPAEDVRLLENDKLFQKDEPTGSPVDEPKPNINKNVKTKIQDKNRPFLIYTMPNYEEPSLLSLTKNVNLPTDKKFVYKKQRKVKTEISNKKSKFRKPSFKFRERFHHNKGSGAAWSKDRNIIKSSIKKEPVVITLNCSIKENKDDTEQKKNLITIDPEKLNFNLKMNNKILQESSHGTKNLQKEYYLTCPFDSSHKVPSKTFPKHVIACRDRLSTNTKLVTCPFNFRHLIPEKLYSEHVKSCQDQTPYESEIATGLASLAVEFKLDENI